ncbi:MAG: acyl-CoA dehydrogenase family protein [Pseudomonadota bacterium]
MSFDGISAQEADILAAAKSFATDYIAPNAQTWERDKAVPKEMFTRAADAGLLGLLVPVDQGGAGISYSALLRVLETLAYADMAAAFALIVHNNHARSIATAGSDHLIGTYLADMLAGRTVGAFLLTEPQGGSDAGAITTTAVEDGDAYVINGAKAWISNTPNADLLNVFAQTEPGAKARGIISIQVPAEAPGVTRLPAYEMMGGYAIGAGGFEFHDVRVPKSQVLLPAGQGFKSAMVGIDIARAGVAAMCAGMLQAGLDTAMPRLLNRQAFGGPLADQQGLMWQLAEVATDLEATRLLAFHAAEEFDKTGAAVAQAAHAKKFATRAAFRGIQACMQAMGADGLKQEHPLARHLAAAKMAEYLDGTTEIQNVVISRAMRKQYTG